VEKGKNFLKKRGEKGRIRKILEENGEKRKKKRIGNIVFSCVTVFFDYTRKKQGFPLFLGGNNVTV